MLIFVLQSIWLYISELAGKDLDIETIGKFLLYITPTLIPLILPLTILLASIMVFGSFAENYEFAAMKSTGISLQRAMKSLSVFIVFLGIITFFFSNNVIPWAQFNSYNLRKNIAKLKPAMAIAEGQFNQIGDINIKVSEKSGERGQYLKDVVIHKKSARIGNYTTILSNTGELISTEESDILKLVLFDGNYYDELLPKEYKERQKKPFAKSVFETYTFNVDLSQINNVDIGEKKVTSKYDMLDISQLDYTIDSLKIRETNKLSDFSKNLYKRSYIIKERKKTEVKKDSLKNSNREKEQQIAKIADRVSAKQLKNSTKVNTKKAKADLPTPVTQTTQEKKFDSIPDDFMEIFTTKKKVQTVETALNNIVSTNQIIAAKEKELGRDTKWLNKHIISLHEKFALGFACIILFFVGAPLGALIKKGGIGLPMVIAIVLFLVYHFIGIFAKNSAEDNSINPILASWLSTLIMLPVGIYLTERATKDKGLFDIDLILQPIIKLFKFNDEKITIQGLKSITNEDLEVITKYKDDKLVDIIKNYRAYNYDESYKAEALKILEARGITEKQLKIAGKLSNDSFEEAKRHYIDYNLYSQITLFFYIPFSIMLALFLIFRNNELPILATVALTIAIITGFIFFTFLVKSFVSENDFNTFSKNKSSYLIILYLLFGIPLYLIFYFVNKKRMKEELKHIR